MSDDFKNRLSARLSVGFGMHSPLAGMTTSSIKALHMQQQQKEQMMNSILNEQSTSQYSSDSNNSSSSATTTAPHVAQVHLGNGTTGTAGVDGNNNNNNESTTTSGVFEKPLHVLLQRRDHVDSGEHVPKLVRYAVNSLFTATKYPNKGLNRDGIFRESGSNQRIQELKQLFDEDLIEKHCMSHFINNPFDIEDPHVTTGVLKLYMRMLPEPITTFGFSDAVVRLLREANPTDDEAYFVRELKQHIQRLPELNKKIINTLLFLLHECHVVNPRMKASNLGIVFGSNFFRRDEQQQQQQQQMMAAMSEVQDLNKVVQILIEHYYDLFTGEEPYLYTIYQTDLRARRIQEKCVMELEAELKNPLLVTRNNDYVTVNNALYEKDQYDPLKWHISENAIDEAVLDFRKLIDEKIREPNLKLQFENVYARLFHSIYYCEDAVKNNQQDDADDDEDFNRGPVAYAILLQQKEDIWMRERAKLVSKLEEEKTENLVKTRHTRRTLQRLLESL